MKKSLVYAVVIILVAPCMMNAQTRILLREDFNHLDDWHPLYFPTIQKHTQYSIVTEGSESYLKAESHASASGLVFNREFNVYEYPRMRWRWKVENVYLKGDAHTKAGDDYPLRLYLIFNNGLNDSGPSSLWQHIMSDLVSDFSSINYVWASKEHSEDIIASPYTDRVKMVLVEKGSMNVGKWIEEEVNIVEDYQRAFNQKPPPRASLAIMSDSDDTHESSVSFIDWIEISR